MNSKIAFHANGPQGLHIWVIDPNGVGPARNLTVGSAGGYNPAWSPDATKIAFVRGTDIWVMNADGTGQQPLPTVSSLGISAYEYPAWSPPLWEPFPRLVVKAGNSAMAVARGVNALLNLFERRLPGREVTKIAFRYIWFLTVVNADGTNRRDIYLGGGKPEDVFWYEAAAPTWSPDGTKIAFTRRVTPGPPWRHVAVINADGSGLRQLTFPSHPHEGDDNPAWSPDSSKIAFDSDRSGNRQVWVMNVDGSGALVNLTNRATGDDNSPAWWPAGGKIAFASDRSGKWDIWTMDENGTGLMNITASLAAYNCFNPAWSIGP